MRQARFNDGWRRTQDLSNYNCQLRQVLISGAKGVSENFCLELNSGVSVLCGKNGVGKSTVLKSIYSHIKKNNLVNTRLNLDNIKLTVIENKSGSIKEDAIVNYLEPSVECNKIIRFLNESTNIDDFIEGLEPNGFLGKRENIEIIGNIIGRSYSKIELFEVDGVLADDYTFPFIKVTLPDGLEYSCMDMGAGEYLCMYIFWYINWVDSHSILLIDEIENCISVYSQEYLMDYLANVSSRKGIWILLSSHSETILNKVGIRNARLISNINSVGISVVSPKHERKYLTALGVRPRKKGVFLVEDKFSYMFLKGILNHSASDIAYDYNIVSFKDGESDIEKVVKHFNPHKDVDFKIMAVFDADMHEKIGKLIGKSIPVTSLPSIDSSNPELELWRIMPTVLDRISKHLGPEIDDLLQYFEQCNSLDHHDRFMRFSELINVSEEILFNCVFSIWFEKNTDLVNNFIFSILISNYELPTEEIKKLLIELKLLDLPAEQNNFSKSNVFFDGAKLNFI